MTQTNSTIRVLHLPYQTPYVRKLVFPSIEIINETIRGNTDGKPVNISFRWLCEQGDLDFFDVLHIHFIDFDSLDDIEIALKKCIKKKKRIVFTAHNIFPMYQRDGSTYLKKLHTVCSSAHSIVTLTQSCADRLTQSLKNEKLASPISVLPHGLVAHPNHPKWGRAGSQGDIVEYALFGSFRPNREIYAFVLNWYFSLINYNARLNILSPALCPCDIYNTELHMKETISLLQTDKQRMRLLVLPFPTDDQIIDFLSNCDVLVMPYLWGSHSGQLELAFDLNLLPFISDVGFYADQWRVVQSHIQEPIWFNWSDGNVYSYGLRLVEALLTAQSRAKSNQRLSSEEEWREYRIREHENLLSAYLKMYIG